MSQQPTALITVQAFSLYGPRAASHRVRLQQYQSGLAARGIDLQIHSLLDAGYVPQERRGLGISKRALLAAFARRFNSRVTLLPSVVDTERYQPLAPATGESNSPPQSPTAADNTAAEPDAPFTVGWIGSPSTAPYLRVLVEPLQRLARERPLRLLVVGGSAPVVAGVQVIEQPWSLADEVQQIQRFDVGVMPLPDTAWTRGKCAYKLIQCLACGVPVVASHVGANLDVVTPACGVLAGSASEWLSAFRELAAKPLLRAQLGTAGRRWVEARYSLRSALPILEGVIREVAEQGE